MAETLSFEAVLNAQQFMNGINQLKSSVSQLDLSKGMNTTGLAGSIEKDLAGGATKGVAAAEKAIAGKGAVIGAGLSTNFLSGFNPEKVGSELQGKITGSLQKVQQGYVQQTGMAGQVLSAAGPYGILAAAIIGVAVASEKAAEAQEKLYRATAKAAGTTTSDPQIQALMRSNQNARMDTGISSATFSQASTSLTQGGVSILAAAQGAAASTGIWAQKWNTDAASVGKSMTELGNKIKPETQSWKQFIDQQGTVMDTLAAKTGTSAASIMAGMQRMAPIMTRLGVPAEAVPSWEALIAVMGRAGIPAERVGKSVQAAVAGMTGKNEGDFAKLLGLDTKQFESQMQSDVIGTIQKVAEAIKNLPIKEQTELLQKLGGGKDIVSLLGDPAKADQLKTAIEGANKAANSGKTAQDAYAGSLKDAGAQMDRIKESLTVLLERLGGPLIGGFASGVKAVADFAETLVNLSDVIDQDVIKPFLKIVDTIMQNPILQKLFGTGSAGSSSPSDIIKAGINNLNPVSWIYGAGSLVNTEEARLTGKNAADLAGQGIKDSNAVKTELENQLNEGAKDGGKTAGELAAEEFAKSNEDWIKNNGRMAELGYWYNEKLGNIQKSSFDQSYGGADQNKTFGPIQAGGFDITVGASAENEGHWKYTLQTPTGPINLGYNATPSEIVSAVSNYLRRQLTPLEAAKITGNTEEIMRLNMAAEVKADLSFVFDPITAAKNMKDGLIKTVDDINSGGAISDTKAHEIQDQYKQLLTLDPSTVSGVSGNNLQALTGNLDALAKYQDQLSSLTPENSFAKFNDSFDHARLNLMNKISQTREAIKTETTQMISELGTGTEQAFETPIANAKPWVVSQIKDMASQASSAWKDGLTQKEADAILAFEPEINYMKDTFPQLFNDSGGNAMLELVAALKAHGGDVEAAMADIGKIGGQAFEKNLVGGAALAPKALVDLINDPKAMEAAVVDQKKFWQGTLIPTIKSDLEEANKALASGQFTEAQVYDNYIKPLESILQYMPGWMSRFVDYIHSGKLNIQDAATIFDEMTDTTNKLTQATKDSTVGYNQLKDTIQGCADCVSSAFGDWQESQSNLFQGSYIGEGGAPYEQWKTGWINAIADTQNSVRRMGGVSVGKDYTQEAAALNERTITVKANTTPADTAIASIQKNLDTLVKTADPVKVGANTSPFDTQVNLSKIAASQPVTIPVYYNYENSLNPANGPIYMSENPMQYYGSYAEGTDYVPKTGPYLLHQGEKVTPAGQSAGNSISIGPTIIEGNINGVDDFEERMDQRDSALMKKMNDALKSMAKAG